MKDFLLDDLAPIVLFVYNRPQHTKQTIESLKKNQLAEKSELFIFSDGSMHYKDKNSVEEVRAFIKTVGGFKIVKIIERERNFGLVQSIISGVTEVVNKYGKIIVMEDDLIVSQHFLSFMNNALNHYEKEKKVFSVTGYNYPNNLFKFPKKYKYTTYFSYRCGSWSWATWKDRWNMIDFEVKDWNDFIKDKRKQKLFNRGGDDLADMLKNQMDGRIDSWAIKFCYSHFKHSAYCLYPRYSLVKNIGLDGSGIHCVKSNKFDVTPHNLAFEVTFPDEIRVNQLIAKEFRNIFKYSIKQKLLKLFTR